PLTEKGALVKQHLQGIDAFASQTQLLDRGTSADRALPFAVLFGRPRDTGKRVVALVEAELDVRNGSKQWLTSGFLTWSRIVVRMISVLSVIAAITFVSIAPQYAPRHDPISYEWGPPENSDFW